MMIWIRNLSLIALFSTVLCTMVGASFARIDVPDQLLIGERECGTATEFEFRVVNAGLLQRLSVEQVGTSCQCLITNVVVPFELGPGESKVIKGVIQVPSSPQSVVEKIAIRSNSVVRRIVSVPLKLQAALLIRFSPESLLIEGGHKIGHKYLMTARLDDKFPLSSDKIDIESSLPFMEAVAQVKTPNEVQFSFTLTQLPPAGELDIQIPLVFGSNPPVTKNFRIAGSIPGSLTADPSIAIIDLSLVPKSLKLNISGADVTVDDLEIKYIGRSLEEVIAASIEGDRLIVRSLRLRESPKLEYGSIVLVEKKSGNHILHIPVHFLGRNHKT